MGAVIKWLAAISAAIALIIGIVNLSDLGFLSALITWISGGVSAFLLYAFGYMLDTVEENNTYLRELMYRTYTLNEEKPSMGHSRASLDKLKDFKMK